MRGIGGNTIFHRDGTPQRPIIQLRDLRQIEGDGPAGQQGQHQDSDPRIDQQRVFGLFLFGKRIPCQHQRPNWKGSDGLQHGLRKNASIQLKGREGQQMVGGHGGEMGQNKIMKGDELGATVADHNGFIHHEDLGIERFIGKINIIKVNGLFFIVAGDPEQLMRGTGIQLRAGIGLFGGAGTGSPDGQSLKFKIPKQPFKPTGEGNGMPLLFKEGEQGGQVRMDAHFLITFQKLFFMSPFKKK